MFRHKPCLFLCECGQERHVFRPLRDPSIPRRTPILDKENFYFVKINFPGGRNWIGHDEHELFGNWGNSGKCSSASDESRNFDRHPAFVADNWRVAAPVSRIMFPDRERPLPRLCGEMVRLISEGGAGLGGFKLERARVIMEALLPDRLPPLMPKLVSCEACDEQESKTATMRNTGRWN